MVSLLASFLFCYAVSGVFSEEPVMNKTDEDKPFYKISKSALCPTISEHMFCTGKYDFLEMTEEFLEDTELSKSGKVTGKDSGACANALRKALCSSPSPVCLEDASKNDKPVRRLCENLRYSCPLVKGSSFKEYEDHCVSYMKRKFTSLSCKPVTGSRFDGFCPKPEKKMPESYLKLYEMKSKALKDPMEILEKLNNVAGVELLSGDCMTTIKEAVCIQMHCTEDEKTVLMPNMQAKCNKLSKCINKMFDQYKQLSSMLKPVKKYLTDGCDMFVETLTAQSKKTHSGAAGLLPPFFPLFIAFCVKFFY